MMVSTIATIVFAFFLSLVSSHTVITYPGIRADNLKTNGSIADNNGLGGGENNVYPYGMQWSYPCTSSNERSHFCLKKSHLHS